MLLNNSRDNDDDYVTITLTRIIILNKKLKPMIENVKFFPPV